VCGWRAAKRADPDRVKPFTDYALLGDDIVINNTKVAACYLDLLSELGVQVLIPKSLVSNCGALEFAKQFRVGKRDLSPISLKAISCSKTLLAQTALASKWPMKLSSMVRWGWLPSPG